MRYIDRTGTKSAFEKAPVDCDVRGLPNFPTEAIKKMERAHLALLKTSWGMYRIIRESGLGCAEDHPDFKTTKAAAKYIVANI